MLKRIFIGGLLSFVFAHTYGQNIMINEVSQGATGSKEYVELVVAGTIECSSSNCLDLRGWYFDDNSGYFASGTGNGIAKGCLRFANDPQWECVQIGSIILIYNDLDFDPALIPADDETDSNGDLVYVIPVGSPLFDGNPDQPVVGNETFPTTGFISGGLWSWIGMANGGDSFQVLDGVNLLSPVISLSWGTNTNNSVIYFAGSASGTVMNFENILGNNYLDQNNWTQTTISSNPSSETPGAGNNPANAAWIQAMQIFTAPNLDAIIAPTTGLPCGNGDLQLDASVSIGVGLSYVWSGPAIVSGDNTATPTVNGVGTYSVTITDENLCTDTASIVIGQGMSLVVDLGEDVFMCDGATTTLDAGIVADSYTWTPNVGSTQTVDVTDEGTYTVVVDSSGCIGTDVIVVSFVTTLEVDLGNDTSFCAGGSLTLDAENAGSTYTWLPNSESSQTIIVNSSNTYSVTVTDGGGCTGRDTIVLTVNDFPIVNLGGSTAICPGETLILDAGNTGSSFIWTPNGEITQTISVTTAGNYSVTVTNVDGCSSSDNIDVMVNSSLIVDLGTEIGICAGGSTILDAGNPGGTYVWSPNLGSGQTISVSLANTYYVTVTSANGCTGTDDVLVTINNLPTVYLGSDTSICTGFTLLLDAQNIGSTFLWSPNSETGQTILVSAANNYSVVVTDGNSCTATDDINVAVTVLQPIDLGNDTSFCSGNSLLLDAGNTGVFYNWLPNGETSSTVTASTTGSYSVTVTETGGCTTTGLIDITVNEAFIVNIGNDTSFCFGGSLLLDAGYPGLSYNWLPGGETSQTLSVNSTDIYSVTVTDVNDCIGIDNIIITVNTLPVIDLGGDQGMCEGSSITLDAGIGSSFIWSPNNETTQTINVSTAGTFGVTVTDSNGCTGSDDVTTNVNGITVALGNDTTVCDGVAVTIDAQNQGSTYLWSTSQTSRTIVVTQAGTYSVTVTSGNSCTGTDTFVLSVNSLPTITMENAYFCEGGSTSISAGNSGSSYLWSNGETTETIVISEAGVYTVQVTSAQGCSASGDVTATEVLYPVVNLGDSIGICFGVATTLDAENPGMSYLWSPTGDSTQAIIISSSGAYSVTVSNFGCTSTDTVNITVFDLPIITTSENQSILEGESVEMSVTGDITNTYVWSPATSLDDPLSTTPMATPTETTTYSVVATDTNNCTARDSVYIFVTPLEIITYNTFTPNVDGNNDTWHIENISSFEGHYVEIYNRNGNLIYATDHYESNEWKGTYKGNPVPAATYYYIIDLGEGETLRKGFITLIR